MLVNPYYLLFLPAIPDPFRIHEAEPSVHSKIMADFRRSVREALMGSRPGALTDPETKSPKSPIYYWSLGVLDWPRDPAGAGLKPPITDRSR